MAITTGPNLNVLINGNKGEEHYNQLMHQWRALDGLVQPVAISMGSTTPPGSSDNGDCHIVGVGATGAWAGMDNRIARYFTVGVGAPAWEFYVPKSGWQMRILSQLDSNGLPRTAEYSGTAWGLVESGAASEVPVEEITTSNYDVDSSRNGAYLRMTATGGTTVTIRTQAIHPLPDNGVWHIRNAGDDDMTVVPEGVILNAPAGGSYTVPPSGIISIKRVAVNVFDLLGVTAGSGESSVVAADFETSAAYLSFTDNAGKVRLSLNESGLGSALGLDAKADTADIGAANGIAPLDSSGRVPSANLPSYVDDVLEYANIGAFPATGETAKIYISLAAGTDGSGAFPANQQFRWSGSSYQRIVASPGTTDNVPEGTTNLYHTPARVRATTLTGFVAGVGFVAVLATDTILQAFNKIQGWLNGLGTASQANVTTSATDTTSGRLWRTNDLVKSITHTDTTVGSIPVIRAEGIFGLGNVGGAQNLPSTGAGSADLQTIPTGLYVALASSFASPPFGATDVYLDVHRGGGSQAQQTAYVFGAEPRKAIRNYVSGSWSGWREEWNSGNLVKTTSSTDTTAGRFPTVGWMGLGGNAVPNDDWDAIVATGFYYNTTLSATGIPTNATALSLVHINQSSTNATQWASRVGGDQYWYRRKSAGVWQPWVEFWHTGNTSTDVRSMLGSANNAAIRSNIGAGTVSSVSMTVPAGLSVSGGPITGSGTFAVSLQSGYSIPTTASQTNWNTAFAQTRQWDGGSTGLVAETGRASLGAQKKTVLNTVTASSHNIDAANEAAYHRFTFNGAKTATVRPNSTHALPTNGAWVLRNANTGNLTIVPGSGVTINVPYGGTLVLEPGMAVTLQKVGTDEYDLIGQTVPA